MGSVGEVEQNSETMYAKLEHLLAPSRGLEFAMMETEKSWRMTQTTLICPSASLRCGQGLKTDTSNDLVYSKDANASLMEHATSTAFTA